MRRLFEIDIKEYERVLQMVKKQMENYANQYLIGF